MATDVEMSTKADEKLQVISSGNGTNEAGLMGGKKRNELGRGAAEDECALPQNSDLQRQQERTTARKGRIPRAEVVSTMCTFQLTSIKMK